MFETEKETADCVRWIKEYFAGVPQNSAVIGISGGKDSSVAAALLCRALGAENIIGILMPNGEQKDISDSIELVNLLKIKNMTVNIETAYRGITEAVGGISAQSRINIAPRLRMTVLYAVAQTNNALVCGTSNAGERYVGYGTKWGDMAADFNPLGEFLSDEVIAIGEYLGLPEHLTKKPPADGLTGKTDEEVLGFSYEELNAHIRRGKTKYGKNTDKIERMHKNSAHKLTPVPVYPRKAIKIDF